jgi:tryptophan 7-halogenase
MGVKVSRKKLVVVGRGTAGAHAISHYTRWMPDCEIEWHFDPNISTQPVGEGSTLTFPRNLTEWYGFSHTELDVIDGTFKLGIAKEGWGKEGTAFFHDFMPPEVGFHFNAIKFQDYVFNKLKDKVKIVEHNTANKDLDADFIMDCSGKPANYDAFDLSEYINVNAVHVTQCYWDAPTFQYSLNIARPYGWIFGIPLRNRCSIGYLYNNNINTLEEVKEDVKEVFKKYGLTPSDTTNSFSFANYTRKKNYEGRVVYNGNSSFFLEPLEATSLTMMDFIQRDAFELWKGTTSIDYVEERYHNQLKEIETFIAMHYLDGSAFNTKFWEFAKERAEKCFSNISKDKKFTRMYLETRKAKHLTDCFHVEGNYGQWWAYSFLQNISGIGLYDKIDNYINRGAK